MKRFVRFVTSIVLLVLCCFSLFGCNKDMEEGKKYKDPNKKIKILAIGNSFSDDATDFLWDIFDNAGYGKVVIGNLYIAGCSLNRHWENMQNNSCAYDYRKNTSGKWNTTPNTRVLTALVEEEWDYITIQQASGVSGKSESYVNLDNIIDYINQNKTNINAKIYWHMTWAYQGDSNHAEFVNYGNSQQNMYNAILNTVQTLILTNDKIDGVIPSGTAVQNLRTSSLGDTITRDGYHLSFDIGRYSAALTWYAKLSNNSVDGIDYLPKYNAYKNAVCRNLSKIKQAVKDAISTPYQVTFQN